MADGNELNGAGPAEPPTYQQLAEATDASVFDMMTELRGTFPTLGGAIVSGACGGLSRYVLQGLPPGAAGQQVLEAVAPVIRQVAQQVSDAQREAAGLPAPKVAPVAPLQQAFERLNAHLSGAPFSTFVIRQEDHLLLVSTYVTAGGVLSHASQVNIVGSIQRPADVVQAHCITASRTWAQTEPVGLLAKVRERMRAIESEGNQYAVAAAREALQWVVDQFGELDTHPTPAGDDHDGQA